MRLKHIGEDLDATAEMPQLDIRVLSAAFERVEHTVPASSATGQHAAADAAPEWKVTDQLAGLQDQVASLQGALRESENRYSRLAARHETLLQKFEACEIALTSKQHELGQTQEKLAATEQTMQQLAADAADLQHLVADSISQRRQREQFILKQANEIKRLRKLLP